MNEIGQMTLIIARTRNTFMFAFPDFSRFGFLYYIRQATKKFHVLLSFREKKQL